MGKRNVLDAGEACSIARSLGVLGQRWTLLVVREALRGRTKFNEFHEALSISSDVLALRLEGLVSAGVLEKRPYRENGSRERQSYHLTPAGRDLALVIAALMTWGDAHLADEAGPPALLRHKDTGGSVMLSFIDAEGQPVSPDDVITIPGPGAHGR
ncbi:winged helix-turn-helix transcriptional regulator [Streptomyces sp. NPDC059759]|uniref:winged helix-turn-helix transcriptional regulator n=1 Tax=Streptomyces sp. NPDC059759 TaxID=3346936 RepID=UPI003654C5CE